MKIRALSWLLFLALLLPGLRLAASADASHQAQIRGLKVRVSEGQILASFVLEHAFDEQFRQRIESGLPTDLVYRFELERDRRTWFDASVASGSLQIIAMYNAVTAEYLVNFKHDGNLVDSRVIRDFEELHQVMTVLTDFPVFSIAGRAPGERLELRVRAELGTRTLLAFIPRTLATEWAVSGRLDLRGSRDMGG